MPEDILQELSEPVAPCPDACDDLDCDFHGCRNYQERMLGEWEEQRSREW